MALNGNKWLLLKGKIVKKLDTMFLCLLKVIHFQADVFDLFLFRFVIRFQLQAIFQLPGFSKKYRSCLRVNHTRAKHSLLLLCYFFFLNHFYHFIDF